MLWIGSRQFTCGIQFMTVNYDLYTVALKSEIQLTGGGASCMDIIYDESRLAVGTKNGYINTFFVSENSLIYEKILDKHRGRILCIMWDLTGE